jgi:LysM repeat protein
VTVAVLLVRAGLNSSPAQTSTLTTRATTATTPASRGRPRYYRLRAGETLSDIALRFNTTVGSLLTLNPRVDPNALRVGQRIRIR